MAHFVPIPPDKEYWVPKLTSLSLHSKDGTAAIAVWGLPDFSYLAAENNDQFYAEEYRKTGDVRFFYIRGLKAGDKIAAFIFPAKNQVTAWLPIVAVAGDHWSKERAAGKLPRSKYMPNVSLDPFGAEQRLPPVPESTWMRMVDETIAKIRSNPIGAQVLGGIIKEVTIRVFIYRWEWADSSIMFSPQTWQGKTAPGATPDETLHHEFVHILDNDFQGYVNNPTDGLEFTPGEFLAITATNLYASVNGRPLRKDHDGFDPMPAEYANNAAKFKAAQTANFASVQRRLPAYSRVFANSSARWNPFR